MREDPISGELFIGQEPLGVLVDISHAEPNLCRATAYLPRSVPQTKQGASPTFMPMMRWTSGATTDFRGMKWTEPNKVSASSTFGPPP